MKTTLLKFCRKHIYLYYGCWVIKPGTGLIATLLCLLIINEANNRMYE